MRILQIAHDHSLTGAGIAAGRLQSGLVKIGVDSKMLVYKKAMDDPCQALPERKLLNRNIDRLTRAIDTRLDTQGLTNFSSMFWSFADRDVLNLHSISMSWFNLHKLKMLARQYPLVLTMHDMSYGTAVCHYTAYYGDCTAWKTGCGDCPAIAGNTKSLYDLGRWVFQRKSHIFQAAQVTIVTPSRWLHKFATETPMLNTIRIEYIPNGIDTDLFKPMGRQDARRALDLPLDQKLLAFIASNPGNPRKGFQHLPSIFERLKDVSGLGLLVVGDLKPEAAALIEKHFPVYYVGVVRDPRVMRLIYNASDMFILPSEADNLPNTMLESLACGTPVVAFEVGGIPDGVKNGLTGITAPLGEYEALTDWMRATLADPEAAARMREDCRRFGLDNFTLELQASRYQRLYQSLIDEKGNGSRRPTARAGDKEEEIVRAGAV